MLNEVCSAPRSCGVILLERMSDVGLQHSHPAVYEDQDLDPCARPSRVISMRIKCDVSYSNVLGY